MQRDSLSFLFAGLLTASVATAQTLDGNVQRNPDDTVTYTIDLDGPPRGSALLFGSIGLGVPWNIPGIGQLYLDPLSIFGIGPQLQLDGSGQGSFQITVPWQYTDGLMLGFQALCIDASGQLALTLNPVLMVQDRERHPQNPECNWDYGMVTHYVHRTVSIFGTGQPGGEVRFRILRPGYGTIVQGRAPVRFDRSFDITETYTAEPRDGDILEVYYRPNPNAPWKISRSDV